MMRRVEGRFNLAFEERCLTLNDLLKIIIYHSEDDPSLTVKLLSRRDNIKTSEIGQFLSIALCKKVTA